MMRTRIYISKFFCICTTDVDSCYIDSIYVYIYSYHWNRQTSKEKVARK